VEAFMNVRATMAAARTLPGFCMHAPYGQSRPVRRKRLIRAWRTSCMRANCALGCFFHNTARGQTA